MIDIEGLRSTIAAAIDALAEVEDRLPPQPGQEKPTEPMIRLFVDLPESLHTKLKLACVAKRRNMADEVRGLIERHVAAEAA